MTPLLRATGSIAATCRESIHHLLPGSLDGSALFKEFYLGICGHSYFLTALRISEAKWMNNLVTNNLVVSPSSKAVP